jgi:hypothetical protein
MTSAPAYTVFPGFGDTGLKSIYELQSLSNTVAFLTNMDYAPSFHLFRTAAQTATGLMTFNQVSYDPAGMSNGTGVTIPLAGIYHFKAVVPIATNAVASTFFEIFFQFKAGANNPNFAVNTTNNFGGRGSVGAVLAATDTVFSTASAAPMDLYPGDQITVQIFEPLGAQNTTFNNNSTPWQGRMVPSFMGKWIRNII